MRAAHDADVHPLLHPSDIMQGWLTKKGMQKNSKIHAFLRWFGEDEVTRLQYVRKKFKKIYNMVEKSSYRFYCSPSECTETTLSYVYPSDRTHTIYLCDEFFEQGLERRLNSQPGTILREMIKFYDIGGTMRDFARGQVGIEHLARKSPQLAIHTSGSYSSFAEDVGAPLEALSSPATSSTIFERLALHTIRSLCRPCLHT